MRPYGVLRAPIKKDIRLRATSFLQEVTLHIDSKVACVRPMMRSTRTGGIATRRLLVAGPSSSAPRLCAPSDEFYSRGQHSNVVGSLSLAPRCWPLVVGTSSVCAQRRVLL